MVDGSAVSVVDQCVTFWRTWCGFLYHPRPLFDLNDRQCMYIVNIVARHRVSDDLLDRRESLLNVHDMCVYRFC